MNICNDEEGIYLIHTREFYNNNKPIFKIGRSHTLENRIKYYPKGSKIICMINCINSVICEKELIKIFKEKFTQKLEYGIEYFEGDKNDMIIEILLFIHKMIKEEKERLRLEVEKVRFEEDRLRIEEQEKSLDEEKNIDTVQEQVNDDNDDNDDNNNIITNDISNVITTSDKLLDRTCPKCKSIFKYKSIMRNHMKKSFHCLSTDEEIDAYLLSNTEVIVSQNKIIKCEYCNIIFKSNSSLFRHKRNSICSKKQSTISSSVTNTTSNEEFINLINSFSIKLTKHIEQYKPNIR